jgi:exodeoxyribonuclease VIII
MLRDANRPQLYHAKHIAGTIANDETDAMQIGSITHHFTLTPEQECPYIVAPPCDRRTEEGKQLWAEFTEFYADRTVVSEKVWQTAKQCTQAILSEPIAKRLLDRPGVTEGGIIWNDIESGLGCKCRPDHRTPGIVLDIKTCQLSEPRPFIYSIADYGYHQQAAWYLDGITALEGYEERTFVIIAVSTNPPHEVAFYEIDPEDIAHGRDLNRLALERIVNCQTDDCWRADWQKKIVTLSLSNYQRNQEFVL